ncbi:MAG: redoxin domain-containing protein [Chloroflexi bacterium]|nr:redoxin domain-containing protein [Chloroflexota bacterium]
MPEGESQAGPKFCRQCGGVVPEGTAVCPRCGQKWYMDKVEQQGVDLWQRIIDKRSAAGLTESSPAQDYKQYRCPNCMAVLKTSASICPHCGKSTTNAKIVPPGQASATRAEDAGPEPDLPPSARGLASIKGAGQRAQKLSGRGRLKTLDKIIIIAIVVIVAGIGFLLARQYGLIPSSLTFFKPPVQQAVPVTPSQPVISDVAISDIASDTAVIAWSTKVPAWGKVLYGKTETYGDSVIAEFQLEAQKVTLKGLEPSTLYHFMVLATDGKGLELARGHDNVFTTNPRRDTLPPVVMQFKVIPTDVSAVVTWTTDEPASSQVLYGADSTCSKSTQVDPNLVKEHSVRVIGLEANTPYYYRIKSADADGNDSTMDPPNMFITLVSVPTGPRIGDRAPDFTLPVFKTLDTISLRDYRGQKILLTFWAIYCPECDRELSLLQTVQNKNIPGVKVIAIFIESKLDDIDRTIAQYKTERGDLTVPVVVDMYKTTAHLYNVEKAPCTIFIDGDMIIRDIEFGSFNVDQVERILNSL